MWSDFRNALEKCVRPQMLMETRPGDGAGKEKHDVAGDVSLRDCDWPRSGQSFSTLSPSGAVRECPLVADGKPGSRPRLTDGFGFYGMMDIGGVTGQPHRWVSLVSADWCSLNLACLSNLAHLCPSEVRKTSIFARVWMINLARYLMTDAQIPSLPFEANNMGLTCLHLK